MQNRYEAPIDGLEVQRSDLNTIAFEASAAEDRVYSELLRPSLYNNASSVALKYILPFGNNKFDATNSQLQHKAIVSTTASADATVTVNRFRAVIGTRSSGASESPDGVRSAETLGQNIQLAATTTNNRIDLIYAKVDIDINDTTVDRYVRDASGAISTSNLAIFKKTTVTLLVTSSSQATNPSKPNAPADTPTSFHIPLAYVFLHHPHTLTSPIPANRIMEVAAVIGVSPSVGGVDAGPVSRFTGRDTTLRTAWTPAAGRPREYMSNGMTGKVERYFGLHFDGSYQSIALSSTTDLDNSIDWRARLFKVTMYATAASDNELAWNRDMSASAVSAVPYGNFPSNTFTYMGQSMSNGSSYGTALDGGIGIVARFAATDIPSMSSSSAIVLFVDASTGRLRVSVGSVNPMVKMFVWLEATGAFDNKY